MPFFQAENGLRFEMAKKMEEGWQAGGTKTEEMFLKVLILLHPEKACDPERPDWNSLWNVLNHSGGCYDVSWFTQVLFAGGIDKMLTPRQPNVYCAPIRTSAATRRLFKTNMFNPLPGIFAFHSCRFSKKKSSWNFNTPKGTGASEKGVRQNHMYDGLLRVCWPKCC